MLQKQDERNLVEEAGYTTDESNTQKKQRCSHVELMAAQHLKCWHSINTILEKTSCFLDN